MSGWNWQGKTGEQQAAYLEGCANAMRKAAEMLHDIEHAIMDLRMGFRKHAADSEAILRILSDPGLGKPTDEEIEKAVAVLTEKRP